MPAVRRHALLVVEPSVWGIAARTQPLAAVRDWAARGWPLICRRPLPSETGGIALGLPLPPTLGKQRLSFLLPADALRPYEGSSCLSAHATCPALTDARREDLARLLAIGARYGVAPAVTGSLLWAGITGLPYLSDRSDLDLVWHVEPDRTDIGGLLNTLHDQEKTFSMPLDGEVIFPGDRAVQWRELLHALSAPGEAEVMVKSLHSIGLVPVSTLMAPPGAAAPS
ncbi:malonate decarboxylase holo-[acyl-carrier-protein] synthase [Gluconacetobacter takamatsuzukensis]|uniref:Malonate decarboxylase holo-[acyl-carrier-protein] synthase n=1 Tax=Gluconacetobacter takamatsuzukensis TaxID=1286190 RepID=A0A7W4KFA8_9PROT|nr:malonate decarboxylase holo-[acyl-carrier-protein] synthase [Gluconacetobacter takamatsuzukensis]MBB2205873.1 malonate decarboxylase holo-[acyl-carrier-protein] synthase [Gluconacetobacter takamatsuzukensis]